MFHKQPNQLDQNKDNCRLRYCQRTDWDGAVIVRKRFCTPFLRRKRGHFDPASESEDRQNRNDILNIYSKGCEYGSIDILLGFGGSVFMYLWVFDWCRFLIKNGQQYHARIGFFVLIQPAWHGG
jgi:hypothetical protein